jgi:uncharacterized membrane protein
VPRLSLIKLRLEPSKSLRPEGANLILVILGGFGLVISGSFMVFGAWPVFGFMALDVLLIYIAFQAQYRRSNRGQEITISNDKIEIKYFKGGVCVKTILLNKYWAKLEQFNCFNRRSKLMFSSHGKFSEIGEFLSLKEKQKLVADLKPLLGNGHCNATPADSG